MKNIKKIFTIGLVVLLTLCMGVSLGGCKDKEDCIPETLGKAEGLYLYYDNYRSLTDGTQQEVLLSGEIIVDGVTYTEDEYSIDYLKYMTVKKEILYCLSTDKEGEDARYLLWHYNYDTKESGYVYSASEPIIVSTSDYYVFAVCRSSSGQFGALFDEDLNFITDGLARYSLREDLLFDCVDYEFAWWKDGNFFSVGTGARIWDFLIKNDYVYLFLKNTVYIVNLDSGEYTVNTLPDGKQYLSSTTTYGRSITVDGITYFITYSTLTETEYEHLPLMTGCSLWALRGEEMWCEHEFPKKYEVDFGDNYNEEYINLSLDYVPSFLNFEKKIDHIAGYYDIKTKKTVVGPFPKQISSPKKTFVVGEYEFYTDSMHYGAMMGGYYCYYLHRIYNGNDEILQYYFAEDKDEPNPILFEDIYEK